MKSPFLLARADRLLWVWLSCVWNPWRSALVIVKPETVIAWHRQGVRLFWTWKSRVAYALLRREGVYSSLLTNWRRQREQGALREMRGRCRVISLL